MIASFRFIFCYGGGCRVHGLVCSSFWLVHIDSYNCVVAFAAFFHSVLDCVACSINARAELNIGFAISGCCSILHFLR